MRLGKVLVACAILIVPLLATRARADEDQFAPLSLFVNEAENEPVTVLLRGEDVLVVREDLARAGLRKLPTTPGETIHGKNYVSLSALGPAVRYTFDERALSLRVVAPPEYFASKSINLRSSAPPGMVQYKDMGLFLNYAPRLVDFRTPAASGEAGLSLNGHLFFSGISYTETQGVVRGLSNLTVDEPSSLRRWVFGDSFVTSGGPLAGARVQGGVSVGRAFQLDPYFIAAPTLNTTGTALTASTLEVYVNGILIRREAIDPGSFQLQNIPLTSGSGTTRYVLRDAFGREQQVVSNFYASSSALAKGLTDYNVSFGAARKEFASSSWRYGGLAMSGYYRLGASDVLTAGFRGEAALGLHDTRPSGGPFVTLLTGVGQFDFGVAGSVTHDGNGVAGSAAYIFTSRFFSTGVTTRGLSAHYSNTSLGPLDNRDVFDGSGFVSVPIGSRVTMTTSYLVGISRDSGLSGRVGLQTNVALARYVSLGATAGRSRNQDGTAPVDAFAVLTVQLGPFTASAAETVLGKHTQTSVDISKPVPVGEGFGFRASATGVEHTHLVGTAQAQLQYGQAQIGVDAFDREVHSSLDVAGAVVIMPRAGIFFTRPVQDGYAVIQVVGAKGVRGYLSNNEIGRTNAAGNLLVPSLLSYYANRLSVSDQDVPLDYRIDEGEYLVAPPYRGGALVRFEAKKTSFVRGTLAVRHGGKLVVPSYGEVTLNVFGKSITSPVARAGEFEFEGLAAGTYSALVEYAEGDCTFSLVVSEPKGAVADLGNLICEGP
ncbi:MAG: fimbria/pilus outer membrane usher protein [Myxococcota bacterium]|nr:fimbria/pilus outer membrane usher protein [Myxococcota bacterium]